MVFGKVLSGKSVVRQIENLPTQAGDKPSKDCIISDCGELIGDEALAADVKQPDSTGDPYEDFPEDAGDDLDAKKILKIASECKEFGTKAFKEGNVALGLDKYQKGLRYLNEDPDLEDEPPSTKTELDELRFALNNNSALLQNKLEFWDEAVSSATSALNVEGPASKDRAKALFRRGIAHNKLKDEDSALTDLEEASKLQPADAAIKTELAAVKAKLASRNAKQKAAYKKFFS